MYPYHICSANWNAIINKNSQSEEKQLFQHYFRKLKNWTKINVQKWKVKILYGKKVKKIDPYHNGLVNILHFLFCEHTFFQQILLKINVQKMSRKMATNLATKNEHFSFHFLWFAYDKKWYDINLGLRAYLKIGNILATFGNTFWAKLAP